MPATLEQPHSELIAGADLTAAEASRGGDVPALLLVHLLGERLEIANSHPQSRRISTVTYEPLGFFSKGWISQRT